MRIRRRRCRKRSFCNGRRAVAVDNRFDSLHLIIVVHVRPQRLRIGIGCLRYGVAAQQVRAVGRARTVYRVCDIGTARGIPCNGDVIYGTSSSVCNAYVLYFRRGASYERKTECRCARDTCVSRGVLCVYGIIVFFTLLGGRNGVFVLVLICRNPAEIQTVRSVSVFAPVNPII